MTRHRNKTRSILFIIGIVLFSLFAIGTFIEGNIGKEYLRFQVFRNQLQINKDLLIQDREGLSRVANELDLSLYLIKNSPILSLYCYFDNEYDDSLTIIMDQWDLLNDNFDSSSVSLILQEVEVLHYKLYSFNHNWRIFYITVLTLNLLVFLYILISISFSTCSPVSDKDDGVVSLRNALIQGQEQERMRISLELHDKVAQDLFACRMIINDITTETEDEVAISSYHKSISLLDSSINEVRDLSYSLRPPALQAIGIDSAIQSYVEYFSKKVNIPISFKAMGLANKQIDESISINLYRILQETLNNSVKHAHADSIDVRLLYTYPYLLLKIDDDGVGFRYVKSEMKAKGRNKLGLPGISERVTLLGGELIINTEKGEGTKILIKVPMAGNEKV